MFPRRAESMNLCSPQKVAVFPQLAKSQRESGRFLEELSPTPGVKRLWSKTLGVVTIPRGPQSPRGFSLQVEKSLSVPEVPRFLRGPI